ncbi:MarR family winged helix-turn-helix transcriptional regulator [Nitrolancea hollandica]|uniref:Transcriptional regulator, MarR family n=1 Tax=Nitrolancea hollandica Lb TaxID=1129897 RepID=I4EDS8_9BACT|nr:MarR family transcriptional regulator [Nitrolancea hollandica]CCF82840.1 Transcriptional regulator, MarR family [Nitrolancea hollandica Lb]
MVARDPEDRRMLGALLRIPFQAIVARIQEGLVMAGYTDLRPAHFVVFQHMRPEGVRLTELAEAAQITKQSMGYLVDYLEREGYTERMPDPTDGRARVIRLTERGKDVERTAREILRNIEVEWSDRLGEERMGQLRETLRDLAAMLER